jgi:uncharacterized membrane protein required for colicin V production
MGVWTDLFLVLFLLAQVWCGWRSGFLWQVTSLATIGFGLILGAALAPPLGSHLLGWVTTDAFHAQVLAFICVAGLVACTLRLLALWAEATSDQSVARKERERRRQDDRILGGVFGALKGGLLALVLVAASVELFPHSPYWDSSRLVVPFATAGSRLLPQGAARHLQAWVRSSADGLCQQLQIRVASPDDEPAAPRRPQAAPGR